MTNYVETVARTVWGEARGCGRAGMQRVANVIMNRSNHPRWWGNDPASVCLQPYQFSCWLPGDPNRAKLLAVTDKDTEFRIALTLAQQAVAGNLPDMTLGADSYYAISSKKPSWTANAVHTISDGWHSFWKVELKDLHEGAPNISVRAQSVVMVSSSPSSDDLNAQELERIQS